MVWAKNHHCCLLDLEGYRADVANTDPMYNIYKYKGEYTPTSAIRVAEHYFVVNSIFDRPAQLRESIRKIGRITISIWKKIMTYGDRS